uniref:MRH domain-containing protein n=1 Tax=Tetradesmus obliquus TaxID=3088 RepID=A0A383VW83_TETOB|eukprot:jgi/Sobl393_1/18894/SZX69024.1
MLCAVLLEEEQQQQQWCTHPTNTCMLAENPSPFVSANPDEPKFIVSLFDDEVVASLLPEVPFTRSTVMTNAAGQQFNCSIPVSPPGAATAVSQMDAEMTPAYDLVKSPFELLEALDGMCLYRQDGLWTYEVCHRQQVRQFRQEAGKKAEDFVCGRFTGDELQSESILEDLSSSGHPLKYVSHKFSGGASCVLTGQPRTAEVRYTCTRGSQDNVVLSVREFPTCNYVVVVSTPFLCKHPSFEPPEEDIRVVSCVPVDADADSSSSSSQLKPGSSTAAAGAQDPAAADSTQAGKDAAAGAKARKGGAAGKQQRKKRPSGPNRSPEYVEDSDEGDELLLLRPQHPDEEVDEYGDDGGYMPFPIGQQEYEQEEPLVDSEQQEQQEQETQQPKPGGKDKQQQQQQQQQQGQAAHDGARDEL